MAIRQLLFIAVLLFSFDNFAQGTRLNLKINPLAAIDGLTFPTLNLGVEVPIGDRLGLYTEVGIKYRPAYYEITDTAFVPSRGIKFLSEIRYYRFFSKKREKAQYYFAFTFNLRQDSYNSNIYYYDDLDTLEQNSIEDKYGTERGVIAFRIGAGTVLPLSKHISIDFFAGMGPAYRTVRTRNMEFNKEQFTLSIPHDTNPETERRIMDIESKSEWIPNLSGGFRFTYFFSE